MKSGQRTADFSGKAAAQQGVALGAEGRLEWEDRDRRPGRPG